jgi:hypothetical protein
MASAKLELYHSWMQVKTIKQVHFSHLLQIGVDKDAVPTAGDEGDQDAIDPPPADGADEYSHPPFAGSNEAPDSLGRMSSRRWC